MGRVEQDHVLHVLVDVPWVRLDEVKGVVGDDPTDPVVLCLGAVVLVSLPIEYPNLDYPNFSYNRTNLIIQLKLIEAIQSEISVSPNGRKTLTLFVLVVQTQTWNLSRPSRPAVM